MKNSVSADDCFLRKKPHVAALCHRSRVPCSWFRNDLVWIKAVTFGCDCPLYDHFLLSFDAKCIPASVSRLYLYQLLLAYFQSDWNLTSRSDCSFYCENREIQFILCWRFSAFSSLYLLLTWYHRFHSLHFLSDSVGPCLHSHILYCTSMS